MSEPKQDQWAEFLAELAANGSVNARIGHMAHMGCSPSEMVRAVVTLQDYLTEELERVKRVHEAIKDTT